MEFLDKIKKYVSSPEGAVMAQSLLSNSGYSNQPMPLSQAIGQGLLAGQGATQREFENKHKESLFGLQKEGMGLRREGLENTKMQTQAYIQNMRQQQAMAYQRLKMQMDERNQQQQAMERMQGLVGNPQTYKEGEQTYSESEVPIPLMNAGEKIRTPNPREQIPQGDGSGLLGGQIDEQQFKQQMTKNLFAIGDVRGAMGLLEPPKAPTGKPEAVLIDGQPRLAQFDPRTQEYVPVKGSAQPMPKNGLSITTKNPDGTETVTKVGGTSGNASGLGKPAINEIEKRMTTTKTLLGGVDDLIKAYDPEYFTAQGKLKNEAIKAGDFVKFPITEKQQEFNGKRAAFEHDARRTLHAYMQSVVGSRGGIKMLEQMEKSFPNMNMRPNEMKWALNKIKTNLERNLETLDELRKTGKFTEDEIKKKADEQAMDGLREVISKGVEGGEKISGALKELSKSEQDPGGLFK